MDCGRSSGVGVVGRGGMGWQLRPVVVVVVVVVGIVGIVGGRPPMPPAVAVAVAAVARGRGGGGGVLTVAWRPGWGLYAPDHAPGNPGRESGAYVFGVKLFDKRTLTTTVRPSYKDDEPNTYMILKTEAHQKAFNHIANFQGIKPNGPGSFYLAAWIMSYNERQLKEIPVSQVGHAAGWNARKLLSYIKEFPTESRNMIAAEYTPVEISDIAEFLTSYENTFGRPISGQS